MNRALEFLSEAYSLLAYRSNHEQARCLVRLAAQEVQELLDKVALYETPDRELYRRIEAHVRPAVLVENGRTRMMLEMKNGQMVDGRIRDKSC